MVWEDELGQEQLQGSAAGCQNNVALTWMCGGGKKRWEHGGQCQGPGVDQETQWEGWRATQDASDSMDAGVIHPSKSAQGGSTLGKVVSGSLGCEFEMLPKQTFMKICQASSSIYGPGAEGCRVQLVRDMGWVIVM